MSLPEYLVPAVAINTRPGYAGRPMRVLLIRLDRIGDLVLTLPVDQSLDFLGQAVSRQTGRADRQSNTKNTMESTWWIPHGLEFVTRSASPPRVAKTLSKTIDHNGFFSLLDDLRRQKFDAAIVFHAPWWVSLLLWMARIPIRGGVKSQWHSFLFFNCAFRQKRSRAECSELEYNYCLVEKIFGLETGKLPRGHLTLTGFKPDERDALLARHGLKAMGYSVVHPGMGGSALNWPSERYAELIERLSAQETVVVTGTKADDAYLAPLRERLAERKQIAWLDAKLSGEELITVLANARTITAPSTGVLHLAASTGRPTLGLFSPVGVQHPRRWGPHGPRVATLLPPVDSCPGKMSCLGAECPNADCMSRISTDDVIKALNTL